MPEMGAQKIEVGVICRNAAGSPDVHFSVVDGSGAAVASGAHHEEAILNARKAGLEPVLAFDRGSPLWDSLSRKYAGAYKEFTIQAFNRYQELLISDKDVSGADLLDDLSGFLAQQARDLAPAGADMRATVVYADGLFARDCGNGRISWSAAFAFLVDEDRAQEAIRSSAAGLVVLRVPLSDISRYWAIPSSGDLSTAADSALELAASGQIQIEPGNAVQVMREELAAVGFINIPAELDPVLLRAMLDRQSETEGQSQNGRERQA